jgi:dTDP-4-dehydrorhamnose reductase
MLYAKQKYEIEKIIRNKFSKYIILRISKVYGYEENNGNILYSWFQQITRGDSNIKCASDFISSPVLVDDVSELILKLIKNNHHGVYHVGGPHAMSRFDMFNALLNEVKKYVNIDVRSEKCSIDDFQTLEPRPKKINLNTDKLSNLFEYKLHTIEEVCKKFVEDNCGAIKG